MKYLHLVMLGFCFAACKCPDPEPVKLPRGQKLSGPGIDLMVTVSGDDKIYVENKELHKDKLDSLLALEIEKRKKSFLDTITVVINADTATSYGMVFNIMRVAKKCTARVVARIEAMDYY